MSSSKNLEFEKTAFLSKSNSAFIEEMYLKFYPPVEITWVSMSYFEDRKMVIHGEEYLSLKARSNRSAAIIAQ